MCGIFGVLDASKGKQSQAAQHVLTGLKRLEYRGYDSWGIAGVQQSSHGAVLQVVKRLGQIGQAGGVQLPKTLAAIGHTRWATHGKVTEKNAHPHLASDGSFALAQNGVVENFEPLKKSLLQLGYIFHSQTDTEVIVRLIEEERKSHPELREAVRHALLRVEGRNTIILLTTDGTIIAVKNGSPLVVGWGKEQGVTYLSSDTLSLGEAVKAAAVLENGQGVEVSDGGVAAFSVRDGASINLHKEPLHMHAELLGKNGFSTYMEKEIHETPEVLRTVIKNAGKSLEQLAKKINEASAVYVIGSGSAGIAAAQIAYFLRKYANVPAVSLVGADATEYVPMLRPGDVVIAPSQSGETADVLEVLEQAKSRGAFLVSYVNMPNSSMTRLADVSFLAEAGPEICVMSTKVFTSQLAWGYLVAKAAAEKLAEGKRNLQRLSDAVHAYLDDEKTYEKVQEIAKLLQKKKDVFLLGKSANFQMIREGMVKLIEGSYIHAHALPAGDLKHYAITLMQKGVVVLAAFENDDVMKDVLTAAEQVKARGAQVIGVGPEPHPVFSHMLQVPEVPEVGSIMNILPLQLLSFTLAGALGHDIDHPRNIAKSVTVK